MKKDAIERLQQRQQLRVQRQQNQTVRPLRVVGSSQSPLSEVPVDEARIAALITFDKPDEIPDTSPEEIRVLLEELGEQFDAERLDLMLGKLSHDVLHSVAAPFGVGKVLAGWDKNGGNVTTINNAGQGIYAREEDEYNRDSYDKTKNSQGQKFAGSGKSSVGSQFTRSQLDTDNRLTDAYTGETVKADTTSPDHITPLSGFHKQGGFMLSDTEKADFATDTRNLASTQRNINTSLKDHDKLEWMEQKQNGRDVTNKEHFGIDEQRVKDKYQQGQLAAKEHAPGTKVKLNYYTQHSLRTGGLEGAKMGAQQAIGLVVVEFFSCTFAEIRDVCRTGRQTESLWQEITLRLKRIASRLAAKWKDIIAGFGSGFLSGFLSNLVTVAVNMFITTGKRAVRMIREGIFSLLKSLKMLFFPPKGLTLQQTAHESMKLLCSGGIVVAGVLLEEAVEKLIAGIPFLTPIAPAVTAVIVGSLTATAMALACYLLDQADFFGAIRRDKEAFIHQRLDQKLENHLDNCEQLFEKMTLL
ncbi:TPA: hypothetical protein R8G81_002997 [Citrobacter youngae]|nr:hypothetical protein [Citrobacter youngae]